MDLTVSLMATSRGTWKKFESVIAEAWTAAIGLKCLRNPLSGANNVNDKGGRRGGDVIIHSDFEADVQIEAKYRSSFMHHGLFKDAKEDAKKHGFTHTILYTRLKSERGYLVVLEEDLFHKMLGIPEVQKLLQKEKSDG